MTPKTAVVMLLCASISGLLPDPIHAQSLPGPAEQPPKGTPVRAVEKSYSDSFDRVWNTLIQVLTQDRLAENPLGKMSADKNAGKITTPTFRYFRIYSAWPVDEKDYRDTYTVTVSSAVKTEENEARAKAAETDAKRAEAKGKTGEEAKTLNEEASKLEAEGAKLAAEAKQKAEQPKEVTVRIERKFEMYDNRKNSWVDADPSAQKVGISAEALFSATEHQLAIGTPPQTDAKPLPRADLVLNPPLLGALG